MYERQERVAEQKHAEIWHTPEPVRAEDQLDSLRRPDAQGEQARPREGAAERREREDRRAQAAARAAQLGKAREHHAREGVHDRVDGKERKAVAALEQPDVRRRRRLADEQVGAVVREGAEQGTRRRLPAIGEKRAEARRRGGRRRGRRRQAAGEPSEQGRADDGRREPYPDERPDAQPPSGQRDADGRAADRSHHVRPRELPEAHRARQPRAVDGPRRADHRRQAQRPDEPHEVWHAVERGDQRARAPQQEVEAGGEPDVPQPDPAHGAPVDDERPAQPRVGQLAADGEEDAQHRHVPEVGRREEAREDQVLRKRDGLDEDLLTARPEDAPHDICLRGPHARLRPRRPRVQHFSSASRRAVQPGRNGDASQYARYSAGISHAARRQTFGLTPQ